MKRLRSFLIVVAILLFGILCTPNSAYATLQSNPATHYKTKKANITWISEIRKMETTGGAMGLTEQLNSDLTPKTDSNNIDVHMMKNTEYGAISILSASSYGNPTTIATSTIKTTTGNKTGVYYNVYSGNSTNDDCYAYGECVAATMKSTVGDIYNNVSNEYFNLYNGNVYKVGDSINMGNWHKSNMANYSNEWFSDRYYGLIRNVRTGYYGYCEDYYVVSSYYSRGVAVCGEGL